MLVEAYVARIEASQPSGRLCPNLLARRIAIARCYNLRHRLGYHRSLRFEPAHNGLGWSKLYLHQGHVSVHVTAGSAKDCFSHLRIGSRKQVQQGAQCSGATSSNIRSSISSFAPWYMELALETAVANSADKQHLRPQDMSAMPTSAAQPCSSDNSNSLRRHDESPSGRLICEHILVAFAAVLFAYLCIADATYAAESAASSGIGSGNGHVNASILQTVVDDERALGPWAPVVYCLTVFGSEAVPLLLKAPVSTGISIVISITRARLWLSLLSGLFFGPLQGAALNLGANLSFAAFAFAKARRDEGPTKLLASLQEEDSSGTVRQVYDRVKGVIDDGKLWQQAAVISVVRITPFAPFRSISYFLGLTPIRPAAYLIGTAVGRGFWSVLYAAIGSYSRSYIQRGVSIDDLAAELVDSAGRFTSEAIILGVALSTAAVAGWFLGVVGPEAPGWPEQGQYKSRLVERRDVAKQQAVELVRKLVPSEEWLQGSFWRAQAEDGREALRRGLFAALNNSESDLDSWLDHQASRTPLRQRAARTVQNIREGAARLGVDTSTIRTQAQRLSNRLDRMGDGLANESDSSHKPHANSSHVNPEASKEEGNVGKSQKAHTGNNAKTIQGNSQTADRVPES